MQDILDNFIGQFEAIVQWRTNNQKETKYDGWSVAEMKKILQDFYSGLIVNGKLKLPEEITTIDLFGYFALINHFKLETLLGNFTQALSLIQPICLNHTIIFSRAFSSQINLFYYSSFCYFMT